MLALWAFIADTAQILGVDWKAIVALVLGTGGGTWLIGVITGVGAFQLAVGVTAVMFFVAGASAFSRHRKLSAPREAAAPETKRPLSEEAKKPRFAPPHGHENFPIGSVSFRDLGDMMIKRAHEIHRFIERASYDAPNARVVNVFLSEHAPNAFWLCEEAGKRGLHNEHLDIVRRYPDRLHNRDAILYIARELEKFGNIVKLYVS